MKQYLFTYGTLLRTGAAPEISAVVKRFRFVGPASVRGSLYDLGEYPGAVIDESSSKKIQGELVELPSGEDVLKAIDEYEEFNPSNPKKSLFVRTKTSIQLSNGRNVQAWIYVFNKDPGNAPLVKGGDYLKSKVA